MIGDDIIKCIFCQKELDESNGSVEHIVPRFLGGNYVLNNVCKECNSKMGADFEGKLSNNTMIQFLQAFYLLKQRKSKKFIVPHLKFEINNMHLECDKEGHIFFYVNPSVIEESCKKTNIIADVNMPQKQLNAMVDAQSSKLKERNNCDYFNDILINETQKLQWGESEQLEIELDMEVINKLFIKIAYEFTSIALGHDYISEEMNEIFKDSIKNEGNAFIPLDKYVFNDVDSEKLKYCIEEVLKVIFINTESNILGTELKYPSEGNFTHKISLNYENSKIFVDISLFGIINTRVIVCEKVDNFKFEEGQLIRLTMGIEDDESYNNVYSDYEELKDKFIYS